jgi:L-Ala-D/L-Glu epimerase
MKITIHRLSLQLTHPFTISRGTLNEQISLVVELEHEGQVGLGEVTENSYYGHTFESIAAAIRIMGPPPSTWLDGEPGSHWHEVFAAVGGDTFATSAVDMALLDLQGKLRNQSVWQMWGLNWNASIASSYTIGLDTPDKMIAKLQEQPGWRGYKIKLGRADDVELVRKLRGITDATFRVDANCAWSADEAIAKSRALAELGVEFIEQPLAPETPVEDQRRLYCESALPIIADESCQRMEDVERCGQLFHGINIKLCKCGGMSSGLKMLQQARQLGLRTMIGCMIESSIGISGSAQLLPMLDYADLDGATLISNDPAVGVRLNRGQVIDYARAGTGAAWSGAMR